MIQSKINQFKKYLIINNYFKIAFYLEFRVLFFTFVGFFLTSCANNKFLGLFTPKKDMFQSSNIMDSSISAEKYMEIYDLGGRVTTHANFIELLSHLPITKKESRIYLIRTDNFSIGEDYDNLNKLDVALESGFIDGMLGKGLIISEKLDHIRPRNPKEFIKTDPLDAFYMHGIDLEDLEVIKNDFNSTTLMNYQIVDFSEYEMTLTMYIRVVDLEKMKIISSGLVQVEESSNPKAKKQVEAFTDVYEIVKNISDFPPIMFEEGINLGVLNVDVLNINGLYKNDLSKKTIAIENGIITGLVHNEKYFDNKPVIMEKSKGFKLKFSSVYKNIVFNTNPILYEEWSEFNNQTNCDLLMGYRYLANNGIYIKVIDVKSNGKIIYSKAFSFNGREDRGIITNHDFIADQFLSGFDFEIFKNRKILILDGDHQSVESKKYLNEISAKTEMNLAIEDGIVSALVSQNIDIFEKLKTLYLKRPWMYEGKIFNLNPLYINEWKQLKNFGVETLIIYQNLIPYKNLDYDDPKYKDVAVSIKVVDIDTGDIIALSGITNMD